MRPILKISRGDCSQRWNGTDTNFCLLSHKSSSFWENHVFQLKIPLSSVSIYCWVIVITEIFWATKWEKRRFIFISGFPPNPSRYLPPRKHICSGEIISVDPKFKILLKKLNAVSPFWIRIKDLDSGWDEDWWSLMSQLHPQNVSQWQYQTMNGRNVMFDQWHIQYCLILRMTLMLQRQHHLPENLVHWV